MATIDAQVEESLRPFRTAVELITSIPGIKNLGAHVIVSEIGIDMSRFPSGAHLISWAVAASMLTTIYHVLKDGTMHQDLGRNYFDRRSTGQQKKRLVKRLADLGYVVELTPLAA